MNLSIAIPTYECKGRGIEFLTISFNQLKKQTFKDFNIIISDNSLDGEIEKYISTVIGLNIKYVKNEGEKTLASNMNNAIRNCDGEIIHILCQDDYLSDKDSLLKIMENFDKEKGWLVSSYMDTKDRVGLFRQQIPSWNNQIYFNNTIGTPSCLTILNDSPLLLDENLSWYVDCEYYYRLYKRYGEPKILKYYTFSQYLWEGQVTQSITQEIMDKEITYIKEKYSGEIA